MPIENRTQATHTNTSNPHIPESSFYITQTSSREDLLFLISSPPVKEQDVDKDTSIYKERRRECTETPAS